MQILKNCGKTKQNIKKNPKNKNRCSGSNLIVEKLWSNNNNYGWKHSYFKALTQLLSCDWVPALPFYSRERLIWWCPESLLWASAGMSCTLQLLSHLPPCCFFSLCVFSYCKRKRYYNTSKISLGS